MRALLLVLFAAACGPEGLAPSDLTVSVRTSPAAPVRAEADGLSITMYEGTASLVGFHGESDGEPIPSRVRATSLDPEVVRVHRYANGPGLILAAVQPGTATLEVSQSGYEPHEVVVEVLAQ